MKAGVLGGTFDPIHNGHLLLAEQAREQLDLDRVLFIPAGDPWRKADRRITPATHRVAMVRLAIAGNVAFVVDEREVRREGPSYTIDTLRELSAGAPDDLYLLLGEDALADLPFWREPAAIAAAATLVVAPRQGVVMPELPFGESRLRRIEMPYIGISATALRERAANGRSLRYQVPEAVEEYIRAQRLYAE